MADNYTEHTPPSYGSHHVISALRKGNPAHDSVFSGAQTAVTTGSSPNNPQVIRKHKWSLVVDVFMTVMAFLFLMLFILLARINRNPVNSKSFGAYQNATRVVSICPLENN
jgi:preprotein translocase subunit SecG